MDLHYVMSCSKTEIEVLCCGCMTIHPKTGHDYPEIIV